MCIVSEGVLHKKLVQAYLIAVIWLAWDTYPTAEVRLIKDTYPNAPIQDKYHLICQRGGIGCSFGRSGFGFVIEDHTDHGTWKEWSFWWALKEFQKGCYFKGAFFWEDLDLDLWSKMTQITVHKRNGVLDELSKNSKKCAILRVRSFGRIWIWICDQRWHRSQCIKGMEF